MRYNLKFAEALHKTDIGLDGIIRSLGGEPIPRHPETIVWYKDGSISSFEIEGELEQNSIRPKENAIKVEIGTNVINIGERAFYWCSKLKFVTIPDGVTNIGKSAFERCENLIYVLIPNTVTNINNYAFHTCSSLPSIIIPSDVISIGQSAFYNCFKLKSVTIPSKVTNIGGFAFYGCPATVTFEGKDKATVKRMSNFRWHIGTNKIVCTDGTL